MVAVSIDKENKNPEFKKEYKFPFRLVSDPDGKVVTAYGLAVDKDGAVGLAKRSVFLVDKEGKLRYIDIGYNVTDGYKPLREAMKGLEKK